MAGDNVSTPSKNGDDSKSVTIPAVKYELMLRVIGQFQQHKSINWSTIHCGNKAKKTLSNMWVKVRSEIAALDPPVVEESAAVKTPRSAKKRTAKTQTAADESDSSPSKKPKKSLPATPTKAQAKAEAEEPEEDSEVKDEAKDEVKEEEE